MAMNKITIDQLSKWDARFLELAVHISNWSKDPSTKVGSVIVSPDRRVLSMGYNGFPRGVVDTVERLEDRETKLRYVSHAERNALDNVDQSLRGCTLYCTLQPCSECTKSIIQKGIKRVVAYYNETKKTYVEDFYKYSYNMFYESGVEVLLVKPQSYIKL